MILVCGEALMDLFPAPAEGAAIAVRAVAGGSPFNVAVGLRRLGVAAAFCGGLSTDHFGQHLASVLEREGVSLAHALRRPQLTTLSVIATGTDGSPRYAFHGEGAADRMVTLDALPRVLPAGVRAIAFGSYSLAVEPCGSAYLEFARREKGRCLISLDPNVRSTIVGDMVRWRERFAAFAACATLVKASDEDIMLAYGENADIGEIARLWLGLGAALVVITRGAKGAIAYCGATSLSVPARAVEVIDTVGAGDAFHAALLARLEQKNCLDHAGLASLTADATGEIVSYAIAASAIVCARRGADLPRRQDVERLIAKGHGQ